MGMLQLHKTVVLVGLMGAGKTAIGKRLAKRLGVIFVDSDLEIEKQQKCTINEIFDTQGEEAFRKMEHKIIAHELHAPPHILATGGGAFIQPKTQVLIKQEAISIWLNADLEVLVERVSRKNTRPLLEKGNKHDIMQQLMKERYPIYAQADMEVKSDACPHNKVVDEIIQQLENYDTQCQSA